MIGARRGAPRDHLLLPVAPTPNGRMHLGHIGGPMLKTDVLARQLRRGGDRAWVIGKTDPYDSFVLIEARKHDCTPEEIVRYWHPLIEADLNAVGIVPDAFANVMDEPWRTRYREISASIMDGLSALGLVTPLRERFPWCARTGQFVTGGFLLGECPSCATATAGYFCEACGARISGRRRWRGGNVAWTGAHRACATWSACTCDCPRLSA